jgi:purine-binding chemotaxis protein CheW
MSNLAVPTHHRLAPLSPHEADSAHPEKACSLLRMAVGDEVVAVGIEDVREILQMTRMTPLPRTPDFVRGVMNLRGAVVPVIDLAARLGRANTVIGRRSCIVVVDCHADAFETEGQAEHDEHGEHGEHAHPVQSWVMGLLVDAVFEVFDRQADEIEAAPSLGTRIAPEYLRGMTRADGELVGVLALSRLLSARELAARIANFQPQ